MSDDKMCVNADECHERLGNMVPVETAERAQNLTDLHRRKAGKYLAEKKALQAENTRLIEAAHNLAMEVLQSDLYQARPDARDAADDVLSITQAALNGENNDG